MSTAPADSGSGPVSNLSRLTVADAGRGSSEYVGDECDCEDCS